MAVLDACPLCRSMLEEGATACPSCRADLKPYIELAARAEAYADLAAELLARGQTEPAREIITRLPQFAGVDEAKLAELSARLALADGDLHAVTLLLERCTAEVAAKLQAALRQVGTARQTARELYNHALSSARQGALPLAAEGMAHAVKFNPSDPALWTLKLKTDLKCGYLSRCYEDLAALDRLGARPPIYSDLEQLLPPTA